MKTVEATSSATVRALLQLRELILSGELAGGARITELIIVERLGVSRTPVRAALQRLAQEGLLEMMSGGGYFVRSFSERDIADAIELRGTLEGLLARTAAERKPSSVVLTEARRCLEQIDSILSASTLDDEALTSYVEKNQQFHVLLREMAQSPLIAEQLERVVALPFASASAFVIEQANSPQARDMLIVAQDQHRQTLLAIEQGNGARAEAIMREHSQLAQRNLRQALAQSQQFIQLIRRRA
jgi:GntR family transcriptional regulator of vanillate catabolism